MPEYSSLISAGVNFSTINAAFNRRYTFNLQYLDNTYFLDSLMQIIRAIRMHIRASHNIPFSNTKGHEHAS